MEPAQMDPIPWKQAPQPKQAALQNIPYKKMPRSMARSIEEKRAKKARTDKANQPMEPMATHSRQCPRH